MLSLDAGDPETVQAVHAKAIEMGGTDDGAPGPRGTGDFCDGYFRDLDGNKLVAFCRQEIKLGRRGLVLDFPGRINPRHPLTNEHLNLAKLRHDLFRLVSLDSHSLVLLY